MISDFFFAQPSFLSGAARALDLWGHLDAYNVSSTPAEADARALFADWRAVGQDLVEAAQEAQPEEQAPAEQLVLFHPAQSR